MALSLERPVPSNELLARSEYSHSNLFEGSGNKFVGNIKSQFLGVKRVYELFKHTVEAKHLAPYDFVIRARTDDVLAICPDLGGLNRTLIWVAKPGQQIAEVRPCPIIMPQGTTSSVLSVYDQFEELYTEGVFADDVTMQYAVIERAGLLPRLRILLFDRFRPLLTRDGWDFDPISAHYHPNITLDNIPGFVKISYNGDFPDAYQPTESYRDH